MSGSYAKRKTLRLLNDEAASARRSADRAGWGAPSNDNLMRRGPYDQAARFYEQAIAAIEAIGVPGETE